MRYCIKHDKPCYSDLPVCSDCISENELAKQGKKECPLCHNLVDDILENVLYCQDCEDRIDREQLDLIADNRQ